MISKILSVDTDADDDDDDGSIAILARGVLRQVRECAREARRGAGEVVGAHRSVAAKRHDWRRDVDLPQALLRTVSC